MTCSSRNSTKTRRLTLVRGQSLSFTETVRGEDHQRVDLTGAKIHFAARTDMKSQPVIKLTCEDPLPATWRAGVELEPQEGDTLGDYTVNIIPADTADLVALGADDPYFYEVWIELGSDTYPDITKSQLDLYPEAGLVP